MKQFHYILFFIIIIIIIITECLFSLGKKFYVRFPWVLHFHKARSNEIVVGAGKSYKSRLVRSVQCKVFKGNDIFLKTNKNKQTK